MQFTNGLKLTILIAVVITACASNVKQNATNTDTTDGEKRMATRPRVTSFTLADFYKNNAMLDTKVNAIMDSLNLDQQCAQMIMPATATNNFGQPLSKIKTWYTQNKIGGVLFLKGTTTLFKAYRQELDALAVSQHLPKLMGTADAEAALLHYKFTDVAKQTPAEKQATTTDITTSCATIINHLKNIGIQTNFAPVADNNVNRAIIKNRSFGSNADSIVYKCNVFMQAHLAQNIGTCIKHFPGHGAVKGDTHKKLIAINGDLTELPAFSNLIKLNALNVMMGHIAINNNTQWNTNGKPASLSRNIVTDLLRTQLQFNGLIYTDALNMGAVSKIPNASFNALCAGVDVALMPLNVDALHAQIKNEITTNGRYKEQFKQSIKRIVRMKVCLGLL